MKRDLNDGTLYDINALIGEQNSDVLGNLTVDESFVKIHGIVEDALNVYAPEKEIVTTAKNTIREPWMTKAILKSSKKKAQLYHNCLKRLKVMFLGLMV